MYKAIIVLALAACVSAGGVYLDHHVGATAEQTVRGFGGLSSISHQAKNVNSAFSTASVYKTKVTNNAVAYAPAAYAAPAYAPAAYAAPAIAAPVLRAAPVAHAIAAPAYAAHAVAAPVARLGVAYSPAIAGVSHVSYNAALGGVHYAY